MIKYTPAMQQYIDLKKQHEDCILFFRLWDFYEVFFEDAKLVSKVLDLVLTSKNKNSENPIPMAGIPHHSVDKYIPKLIQSGYKIAIAEQTTQPIPWKIVEREVVSVITPGTYIKESDKNFSYIVSLTFGQYKNWNNYHIAWWDFTIWEYYTKSFSELKDMQTFVLSLNPTEIIFDVDFPNKTEIEKNIRDFSDALVSISDAPVDPDKYILEQCKIQTLSSFGQALETGKLDAFSLLLKYLENTQKTYLHNIVSVSLHSTNGRVLIDNITLKNLEVFASSYENNEKYSLIWVLDNTKTTAWARLLRSLFLNPIKNKKELEKRVNNIEYYINNFENTKKFFNLLSGLLDLQKILSSILYKRLVPSTFIKLRSILKLFFENKDLLSELQRLGLSDNCKDKINLLYNKLNETLKEDEFVKDDIDFISDWIDSDIDELRKIAYNSDELLMKYQQELVKLSWVANVKLKYVINQWYFIEITNKDVEVFETNLASISSEQKDKFDIIRRNTLKWAQRYTSKYLDKVQGKILEAKEALVSHEFALLEKLKNTISTMVVDLNEFANYIAWFDLYVSHSIFAHENSLNKPEFIDNWELEIKNGRHLVIEKFLEEDQQFIPNNLIMDNGELMMDNVWDNSQLSINNSQLQNGFVHIVTGPNMGWKSTFLRQNALIVLMAHCGLYVPADKAKIPLFDWIFARIWSGDIIAKNQSTFMTEMVEVANILNNATKDSFIIFDELGRWTSTYDWLALTKAILEYVTSKIKAKTLIATHYHELIELENYYSWIKNYSVSVYETDKDVVFMKKITKWWANKSYGLDVAKLAWVPDIIIERAKDNLEGLENDKLDCHVASSSQWQVTELFKTTKFVEKTDPKFDKIKNLIKSFDINNMTPLQAMQLLEKIKRELK